MLSWNFIYNENTLKNDDKKKFSKKLYTERIEFSASNLHFKNTKGGFQT